MGKLCHPPRVDPEGGCVPGCYSNYETNWCPDETRWWHCNGYPPDRLDQMLRVQLFAKPDRYNEIVFDALKLTRLWPAGIEAVVYPVGSQEYTRPQAERLLRDFRAAYGEAATASVALLQVDLSDATGDAPFSVPPLADDESQT